MLLLRVRSGALFLPLHTYSPGDHKLSLASNPVYPRPLSLLDRLLGSPGAAASLPHSLLPWLSCSRSQHHHGPGEPAGNLGSGLRRPPTLHPPVLQVHPTVLLPGSPLPSLLWAPPTSRPPPAALWELSCSPCRLRPATQSTFYTKPQGLPKQI